MNNLNLHSSRLTRPIFKFFESRAYVESNKLSWDEESIWDHAWGYVAGMGLWEERTPVPLLAMKPFAEVEDMIGMDTK